MKLLTHKSLHFNDEIMETVSSEMPDAERQKKYSN